MYYLLMMVYLFYHESIDPLWFTVCSFVSYVQQVFRSRPNTSGRIPSKLSQVRLTPISRGHLDSSDDEQGEGRRGEGRGDRGLVEAKRLLITEVKVSQKINST